MESLALGTEKALRLTVGRGVCQHFLHVGLDCRARNYLQFIVAESPALDEIETKVCPQSLTISVSTPAAPIRGAARYEGADDLWTVTSYFNSHGYLTKRENFNKFVKPFDPINTHLQVIECAFDNEPFELSLLAPALRVRGRDVLWQKERLLNEAIARLPDQCKKVAWLDADVLFERADWAKAASILLDEYPVVQLFDRAIRLPRGMDRYHDLGTVYSSFASIYQQDPQRLLRGDFAAHGHTGFAWAARRDVLARHGLYDACIAGSGDHMMAHAFCGDWNSRCVDRIIGCNNAHLKCFTHWSKRVYADIRARVGCVAGTLLHLWHGDVGDRRYVDRNRELASFTFDPQTDLRLGSNGCWEWNTAKPELHRWARDYFGRRREDGNEDDCRK